MGKFISPPEPTFDFNPSFIPKTITRFLDQMAIAQSDHNNNKISKLEDLLSRLESEVQKIDAFKRELPLCMILMNHAIAALKEELMVLKKPVNRPVLEEFIPLKKTCDEDPMVETDCSDKRNWLSSTQLWNTNQKVAEEQQNEMIDDHNNNGSFVKEFIPFKGYSRFPVEDKEETHASGLSLVTPAIKNPITANLFLKKIGADTTTTTTTNNNNNSIKVASSDNIQIGRPQVQPPQLQTSRKQRRCWSTELHRRFVNALQQLGGSKVATPKQIRELMRVDGLTNDEVKSHLQKYRLHTKRFSSGNESSNSSNVVFRGLWTQPCDLYVEKQLTSQSGSPDGPLLNCSTTGGDSMNDGEDEKSENNV
ncbi:myb family transcription factor EFM-like [Bidens hawaiensis]|uniref:myb family transcription factor EFM-like n=1 Tax=Bidens hawaiensis TaxID=980011 RepID=UPI0040495DFD